MRFPNPYQQHSPFPKLRLLLRALIVSDLYSVLDDFAQLLSLPTDTEDSTEEALSSFIQQAPDETIPGLLLKLAFVDHLRGRAGGNRNYLEEALRIFGVSNAKTITKKRKATKPTTRKAAGEAKKRGAR
jgi:hypothetical protein